MKSDLSSLPDDVRLSKQDIASLIEAIDQKYQEKIHYLEERIRLLQNELFGKKSEQRRQGDNRQMPIFGQLDDTPDPVPTSQDTIVVPAHQRRKRGRKPLPEDLPRVEVIHDLPEEQKLCACGAKLSRIGQETCEKFDYIPAKVQVIRHVRTNTPAKAVRALKMTVPR